MDLNPVVLAIPIYFLLIGIELIFQQVRKIKLYRLHDALTNISCGMTQQLTGLFFKVVALGLYQYLYEHFRLFTIQPTWYNLLVLFVAADFLYYWAHRMSHEINLFWGGHVVHHQSEDYNLSVALRQGSFQVIWTFGFYLPLALVGFDTLSFAAMSGLVTVYQFWIHTETIGKMGWFEWIFNTPSHHRVHHGRDPKYIDKNHAGVFILWDRMFGTFQKEEEKPTYGITTPVNSWNPFWVNVHHYAHLFRAFFKAKGTKNKIGILFNKPGWYPEDMGGYIKPSPVPKSYQKFDTKTTVFFTYYGVLQYLLALVAGALFMFNSEGFPFIQKVCIATLLIFTITVAGGLFENKRWVASAEPVRLLFIAAFATFLFTNGRLNTIILSSIVIYVFLSLVTFVYAKRRSQSVLKAALQKQAA